MLCGAFALPSSVQAGGPASKTFGDLRAGQKFTFTVQSVISSQSFGNKKKATVPVPDGIPAFKTGQRVKFVIGRKGELTGPGFSIPLLGTSPSINSYAKLPDQSSPSPNGGGVSKNSAAMPVGATLIFYKYRGAGSTIQGLTINQVSYVLK